MNFEDLYTKDYWLDMNEEDFASVLTELEPSAYQRGFVETRRHIEQEIRKIQTRPSSYAVQTYTQHDMDELQMKYMAQQDDLIERNRKEREELRFTVEALVTKHDALLTVAQTLVDNASHDPSCEMDMDPSLKCSCWAGIALNELKFWIAEGKEEA